MLSTAPGHNKGQMFSKIGKWYSEFFLFKASQRLSLLARIAFLVAILVNVVMVTVRKMFPAFGWMMGGGVVGGYEVTEISMVFMAACACAYTWYTAGHIRIGIVSDNMKERPRAILDTCCAFLAMLGIAILTWALFLQARTHAAMGTSTQISGIPIAPFMFIYTIVLAHVFLVILRSFIGLASKAMGKKFAHESYLEGQ